MFELEIDGKMYQFNFGIGFVRELNKDVKKDAMGLMVDTSPLAYTLAYIYDGDLVTLSRALLIANKGCNPRISEKELDEFLDNPDTDIDKITEELLDFFGKSNATKKAYGRIKDMMNKKAEIQTDLMN